MKSNLLSGTSKPVNRYNCPNETTIKMTNKKLTAKALGGWGIRRLRQYPQYLKCAKKSEKEMAKSNKSAKYGGEFEKTTKCTCEKMRTNNVNGALR